jgi:hypothetical protein
MTALGLLVLDILGLLLFLWLLNLVRLGRLYVGYALALVVSVGMTLTVLSVPLLRQSAQRLLNGLFPGAEALFVACVVFVIVLVYALTRLTFIANRLLTLVQELALRDAAQQATLTPPSARNERPESPLDGRS